jgi:signal transduction histidine kinase
MGAPKGRTNWKRQALAAERLRFESVKNWKTKKDVVRLDLLALGVAHEFNNILGAALGHADWALETLEPKDMKDALEVISIACVRCAQITKSLQGVVQPREEEKAIFLLSKVFSEITRLWQPRAEKSQVKFNCEALDVKVYLDASAFMEILSNLLKNSFEIFLKNKTANPHITIKTELAQEGFIKIIYQDNGPGIPASYRPYLFQPFFSTKGTISAVFSDDNQGDQENTEKPKNSGLGLFLSRALAQEVGGDLTLVDTPEGQGATFILSVPVVS